jgi:hypothetical protein
MRGQLTPSVMAGRSAGHPRIFTMPQIQIVDGRDKPGHDELGFL